MGAQPTVSDVADVAGVSRQTVSNVLNAPELVRPETRERVQAAIHSLGYRRVAEPTALPGGKRDSGVVPTPAS